MENFNLKKFLTENKLTSNSRLLNEDIEADKETVAEAFQQAGVDFNQPVYVVEGWSAGPGGEQDEPYQVSVRQLIKTLEKERIEYNDEVDYNYDSPADWHSPEDYGLSENLTTKLTVLFSDEHEYVIFQ